MPLIAIPRRAPLVPAASRLLRDSLIALFGWPLALWNAHSARRRLRSYGPAAVLALRPIRTRQN